MFSAEQQSRIAKYQRQGAADHSDPSDAVSRPWSVAVEAVPETESRVTPPQEPSAAPSQDNRDTHEIAEYVLQLEQQNLALRERLATPQALTADAKQGFLNDVMAQVESVVSAHKAKAAAEVQQYRAEAERAQQQLKALRQLIHQEGMDLTLAPAMVQFFKQESLTKEPVHLELPPDILRLLDGVAADLLAKLLAVQDSTDVAETVKTSVRAGFESIVVHFSEETTANVRRLSASVESLRAEVREAEDRARSVQAAAEAHRVDLVGQHAEELRAVQDQLRTYQRFDEVPSAALQQKAFAEYTQLLVETRREVARVTQELENERSHSAEVCLKLKATLQQRNGEFEKEVLDRAQGLVSQRDAWIAQLEEKVRRLNQPVETASHGVQAGDPLVDVPRPGTFVPQLFATTKRDVDSQSTQSVLYEREVWRKTQELLEKYGRNNA